ncbi:MAG TPA: phosphoribosylanthranilate isomerase, partial [Verrucomicrobiae bacterium]
QCVETSGLDTLQFHGEEPPEFCAQFRLKTIKAFRIRDVQSLPHCLNYRNQAWLLDSYVEGALGGTGVAFDWNVAVEATRLSRMVILAGGLKVETVADAVRKVRPFAVDVSSGVESAPGKKDHARLRQFIVAAKSVG